VRGFNEKLKASPVCPGAPGACGAVVGTLVGVNAGFGPKRTTFLDVWLTVLWPISYGVYLYDRGRSA